MCGPNSGPTAVTRTAVHTHTPITGSCKSDIAFRPMAAPSSSDTVECTDLDNHEFAQYILQEHGTYFPKWVRADMTNSRVRSQPHRFEDMNVVAELIPNMKQRIDQIQAQHTAELEKLYAHQAAQYLDDALDRYAAQDDEANGDYSGVIDVSHSSQKIFPTNYL